MFSCLLLSSFLLQIAITSSAYAFVFVGNASSMPNNHTLIKVSCSLPYIAAFDEGDQLLDIIFSYMEYMSFTNPEILPNISVGLVFEDSASVQPSAVKAAVDLIQHDPLIFVGNTYSFLTIPTSLVFSSYNVPMCSGASTSTDLSNKLNYPNFFRTIPPDPKQAEAISLFMKNQGWNSVILISSNDDYGQSISQAFLRYADQREIYIVDHFTFFVGDTDFSGMMSQIVASGCTILHVISLMYDFQTLIDEASNYGLVTDGYVWLTTDSIASFMFTDPQITASTKKLLTGLITAVPNDGVNDLGERFISWWRSIPYYNNLTFTKTDPPTYGMLMATCVDIMLYSIDYLMKNNDSITLEYMNSEQGKLLMHVPSTFQHPDHDTITGPVILDSNGDRSGAIDFFYASNNTFNLFSTFMPLNGFVNYRPPLFGPLLSASPPPDHKNVSVNFVSLSSYVSFTKAFIIIAILGLICCLAIFVIFCVFRNNQKIIQTNIVHSLMILIGISIGFANVILFSFDATDSLCLADVWLLSISFSIIVSFLNIRLIIRMYKVFYGITKINNSRRSIQACVLILPTILLLILWTTLSPPKKYITNSTAPELICRSNNNVFQILVMLYNGGLVLATLLFSLKLAKIKSAYEESRMIAYTIQSIICACIVSLAVLYVPNLDIVSVFAVRAAIQSATLFFVTICYFAIRFVNVSSHFSSVRRNIQPKFDTPAPAINFKASTDMMDRKREIIQLREKWFLGMYTKRSKIVTLILDYSLILFEDFMYAEEDGNRLTEFHGTYYNLTRSSKDITMPNETTIGISLQSNLTGEVRQIEMIFSSKHKATDWHKMICSSIVK